MPNPLIIRYKSTWGDPAHLLKNDVLVRQPLKNMSTTFGNIYGQAGPGQGMGYITDAPWQSVSSMHTIHGPATTDPKSSITNKISKMDSHHILENSEEEKDLGGITYGKSALMPLKTRPDMYGNQRQIPTAYREGGDSGLGDDPELDKIIDLLVDKGVDPKQFRLGLEEEKEHGDDLQSRAKIALDHLVGNPEYYTKLKKVMNHAEHVEIQMKSEELKEVPAMGIGIANDRNLTQVSPSEMGINIKADVKGEQAMKRDEPVYTESDNEDDDELKDGEWVAAFKAGTHTDSDGEIHKWDPQDIVNIAQQYNKMVEPTNPARKIAPITIGHPKNDGSSPAWGWIEKAKAVGNKLYVKMSQLQPAFVDALKKGLYKTRSISLYPDLNIRHVAFLGASQPAVAGLEPFKFTEDPKFSTYEFAEGVEVDVNMLKTENNFFKKLFDRFKIEVKSFKEGTSPDIQTVETAHKTVETISGKFPEGATMAEETKTVDAPTMIQPKDHCRYAGEYLAKFKSFIDAGAVTGVSGTDISSHKEKAEEFANLAMHHLSAAHAEPPVAPPKDGKPEDMKPEHYMHLAHAALVAHDHAGAHAHMSSAHTAMSAKHAEAEKAVVAGNLKPGEAGNVAEAKDHVETVSKDEFTKLTAEFAELKEEHKKLLVENEKIKTEAVEKQKGTSMNEYKEFCEQLTNAGRLRPADVEQTILNLKLRADQDKLHNYSEADQGSSFLSQYKDYLSAMPVIMDFDELIVGPSPANKPAVNVIEAEITKLRTTNPSMQYHEALDRVGAMPEFREKYTEYMESSYQPIDVAPRPAPVKSGSGPAPRVN